MCQRITDLRVHIANSGMKVEGNRWILEGVYETVGKRIPQCKTVLPGCMMYIHRFRELILHPACGLYQGGERIRRELMNEKPELYLLNLFWRG